MSKLRAMDVFGDVESANESSQLEGTESSNELLDYMVMKICRGVASKKAFKDGWMLTKLLQTKSRMTKDIDLSIASLDGFEIERMLADKIIAILSRKRFRRTKDLYDFYILVWSLDFDLRKLRSYIDRRGGAEWDNIPFNDVVLEQYQRAWDQLNLISSKTGRALPKNEFSEVLETFYDVVLPLKAKSFVCPYWRHVEGELCDE